MELSEVDRLVLAGLAPPGRRLWWVVTGLLVAIGIGITAFLYQLERGLGVDGVSIDPLHASSAH